MSEITTLAEYATIQGGYAYKSTDFLKTGKFKVLKIKNIRFGYIDYSETDFISDQLSKKTEEWKTKPKDILISMTGSGPNAPASLVGRVARVGENEPISFINQRIGRVIVNEKVDSDYIYYLLSQKSSQEYFVNNSTGSANQVNINGNTILSLEVPCISFEESKKIAQILNAFDDKIQLNTQINQTLEQIAQALFKSWFVDFDPVRAKAQALSDGLSLEQAELAAMQAISGKTPEELTALSQAQPDRYAELAETANAFPCEMVEVDGVEVPKGWEVKRIDEIANIIKGKSYKSSELEKSKTALVTLKSFNRGGGSRLDGLKEYTGKYKPEQEVFAGELIIAYTDVTQAADVIGKPAMVMSDSNYQHLVISLDVGVVRPFNNVYKHFLYCLAMTDSFQAHTKSFCTGTTVLHLGKDAVPSFEFINPSNELLHVFYKQTSPIFEKINLHIEENKNLEKARDLLLPSLLSGKS